MIKKINATLNHSAAHLLAWAVLKLYPNTKIGFGPAIEEGFYYDFDFEVPITDADLIKIEKQMNKLASSNFDFRQTFEGKLINQPFKQELIKELEAKGESISYYNIVNPVNQEIAFSDLCIGPHVLKTSSIKHFKLLSLAGAYWKGDFKNKQLTRIYGTAWETKEDLASYLAILADRKERDHRKIGKEMNIFMFDFLAGQGFPIWLQEGMIVKNAIKDYVRAIDRKYGFLEVETPALGAKKLYEISGHLAHYQETMFPVIQADNEELIMRPMTCPHHILIYSSTRRSYRDLPIRISEQAQLYRYEKSGALTGLERVRSMELTEGHIFCRLDQIFDEFKNAYNLLNEALKKFEIEVAYVSLSLHDPNDKSKYFDDNKMWSVAEDSLRKVLKELKVEYVEMIGEAAFYGPKIDVQVKTALGHEITMSTLQLDFLLPKRFEITYIDSQEQKVTPVLIHRGLIGTYERFISILLEQTKGVLPFWIAPRQVTIIPVNDSFNEYAREVKVKLESSNIRVHIDDRNERVAKKIREAQISKTKFQVVIGENELKAQTINVRAYNDEQTNEMSIEKFLQQLKKMQNI